MDSKRKTKHHISRRRKMGKLEDPVVQILKVVYNSQDLKKAKEELSLRGRQFITKHPDYTYELTIAKEEMSFVITYTLRLKNQSELQDTYGDY